VSRGFIHRACIWAILVLPLAALLAGCPTRPKETGAPSASQPVESIPKAEGRPFDVIPAESLLTIHAYRGGALARAGHNHVIASHDVTGKVFVNDDIARSSFQLQFPVNTLTVDEPELRAAAGDEFPPGVPDSAKEGTKRNMLGDALLNGAVYPMITLASGPLEAAGDGSLNAQVQVTVRDQTRTILVPVRYEMQEGQLIATGELPLKQSDLGLKPFSVMMGALEVKDDMQVRFRIVARPSTASPPAP
jgi:polyisoprenoid-binding protein YceI